MTDKNHVFGLNEQEIRLTKERTNSKRDLNPSLGLPLAENSVRDSVGGSTR